MDNRIPEESCFQFSPAGVHGSLRRSSSISDRERHLTDLLAERQTLAPLQQILPACRRLLNQEIMHVSGLVSNQFLDQEYIGDGYLYGPSGQQFNGGLMNAETRNAMGTEEDKLLQKLASFQLSLLNWHLASNIATTPIVKRIIKLDVPVDKFLNEEKLKDKPGYEHLNEPLQILVESELPEDIIDSQVEQAVAILEKLLKPMVSMDLYKKEQLRELAMLNGTLREESPSTSPSLSPTMSPFMGMKRAKTGR